MLVQVLTDNKNRTGPELRHTFEKNSGRMGTMGCVAWMFDRRGVVQVDAERSRRTTSSRRRSTPARWT